MKNGPEAAVPIPFAGSRRKTVTVSCDQMITADYFYSEHKLPLVIRPQRDDIDLIGWAAANLPFIKSELLRHGAILFRGFAVTAADQFKHLVNTVSGELLPYREQTSPRSRVMGNVYTSTDYPNDQAILPHNENSYAITFPRKLFFWCETPAQGGGQTPLGDTRRILKRIHPSVADKFLQKGWMYMRNFNPHCSPSWQSAFGTGDRALVEQYCQRAAIEWEWTATGLRTRQVRPAVARHPETGELVWFNHVMFFHASSFEQTLVARLLAGYAEDELPNNTYYGDGSPIEDSVAQHLREAYESEMVCFPWERGDVILVDNMLTAHARAPFTGPRRILFAMTEPYTRTDRVGTPDPV